MTHYHLMKVDLTDPEQLTRAITPVHRASLISSERFDSYGELTTSAGVVNHLVWPDGATLNVPDSAGVQMTIVSTHASDDKDAGTGARTIEIHYLDAALAEQTEIVELEGLTPVLTDATNIRFINGMHLVTYGSGKQSAGVITAKNNSIIYGYIAVSKFRSSSSARMVPAGKVLVIESMTAGAISGTAAAQATIRFFTTKLDEYDHTDDGIMVPYIPVSVQDTSAPLNGLPPIEVEAGVICGFQCDVDKAATITAGFFGWLEVAD